MEDIVFEDFQILEECGVIKGEEYEPIQFIAAKSVNSGDPGPIEILKTFIDQGLDIEEEWQVSTNTWNLTEILKAITNCLLVLFT